MAYKIIDIEGVGDVYAEKLIAAGIEKVEQLLDKCAAPAGRKALAEATGISEKLILKRSRHREGTQAPRGRQPGRKGARVQRREKTGAPRARGERNPEND